MAQRRYGPTRGAGVVVVELEGEKTIEPGALGVVAYAGVLERGPVGELISAQNKTQFTRKCGELIPDSYLPDACHHYYDLARGAGGIWLRRVTDGNEAVAEVMLYARYGALLTPMGKLKAHNGGRWGGKLRRYTKDLSAIGKLTNITLDTEDSTFTTDMWEKGWIELEDVPNKRYPVVGNDNVGVVTVAADQTMLDDYNALSGSSLRYYLYLETEDKAVSYLLGDGEESPDTEFSLTVYLDDVRLKKYPNLSTDPASGRYWVSVINNDGDNWHTEAEDLWTGAHTAAVRPANHYGVISTVTETVLTAIIHDFAINSPGGGDPTFVLGTTADAMVAQKITLTMSDPTTFDAVSDKFGSLGASGTLGTPFTPNNKWTPPFTVTAGTNPLAVDDTLVINYKPFVPDSLIGGYLYPDKPNAKRVRFRIVDNDHKTITAAAGSDLTADGETDDEFLVEAPLDLEGGKDGHADLVDADYNQQAYDPGTSVFNRLFDRNQGLVKMACPGVTSTAVQKAGVAYGEGRNYQWRYEFPSNQTTEDQWIEHVNDTLGRNDFAVAAGPSWGSIADPDSTDGKLKQVPTVGMVHGREARMAVDYDGYHKAGSDVSAKLPALLEITTGETQLDEESLNPVGIAVIKKKKGNFVIWGDRTVYIDPTWKWKHQREQMSHYENVLRENFDWIVFAISDPLTQKLALAALNSYFQPEWVKRAIRGETSTDAAKIKIDAENNTDATAAAGDMYADIRLRLADTVERFIIRIGKQGIFDAVE